MSVYPLRGAIRDYAWGSRTALARLQGRPAPSDGPEAELWLGAHPGDPSTVTGPDGPVSLSALIDDDPKGQLGPPVLDEFGARLPYLMKVLAAAAPLSLQAHPDAAYAQEAFARQEADPSLPRNYTDAYHKPEMLVALTGFEALCGFRAPEVSAAALEELDLPELAPVVAALRGGGEAVAGGAAAGGAGTREPARPEAGAAGGSAAEAGRGGEVAGLREALRLLLTWPAGDRAALVSAAASRASGGLVADLAGHYPGDPGVLVALLLNHVRLNPGEAIWMPAGNLHAYLTGLGVEIMAASDNVLRGGLTPKRVDVDELLRVLRFEVLTNPILSATDVGPGVRTWQVPAREFALYRIELDGSRPPTPVPADGPRIVLGTAGDVFVAQGHGTPVELSPGTAAFAPADAGPISVAGVGEVFVAAVPG